MIELNDTAVEAQRLNLQAGLNVDDLRGIFVSGHMNRPGEPDSGQDWYRFEARLGNASTFTTGTAGTQRFVSTSSSTMIMAMSYSTEAREYSWFWRECPDR